MGDSLRRRARTWIADTFHPANMVAGVCRSYTLSQVRELLEHAASLTHDAKTATALANYAHVLGPAGDRLAAAAADIDRLAQQGKTSAVDADSACAVADAVLVLNRWTTDGTAVGSQEAAKAFETLFGGAGRLLGKLPFPLNQYAPFLTEVQKSNLLTRTANRLDPIGRYTRGNPQLQEALDSN